MTLCLMHITHVRLVDITYVRPTPITQGVRVSRPVGGCLRLGWDLDRAYDTVRDGAVMVR